MGFTVKKEVEITDQLYSRYVNMIQADVAKLGSLFMVSETSSGVPLEDEAVYEDENGLTVFDPTFDRATCMALEEAETAADKIKARAAELRHLLMNRKPPKAEQPSGEAAKE